MHVEFLQNFFNSSPAIRLLRSPHAFWIVDFLNSQFKDAGHITRPHSELASELDIYLERLAKTQTLVPDVKGKKQDKADTYLAAWCSGSIGWLKRYVDHTAEEPCYQLTAEFEKALAFVERASQQVPFIGTESRLRTILEILNDVVAGTAADPQVRLAQLERQRQAIDAQIAHLRTDPGAVRMTETQVRERFMLASQQLRQLKSEFRAVEDRFKAITRSVQQKILSADESRGDILQFALDSEDMLKQGDQGQSFFEFLRLLHAPKSQDQIARMVQELSEIEVLAGEHESLEALRGMVPALIAEAEKILKTTQHLSFTLRRLLDARSTRHHQQLAQVLRDILSAAAENSETPPSHVGIDVEVELDMQSAMDRPFWAATDPFDEVDLLPASVDPQEQSAALAQLTSLERLDWTTMRRNITALTQDGSAVTLENLLQRYPLRLGAIEILGYLQIAFDDGHRMDRARKTHVVCDALDHTSQTLSVPWVEYLPPHQLAAAKRSGSSPVTLEPIP